MPRQFACFAMLLCLCTATHQGAAAETGSELSTDLSFLTKPGKPFNDGDRIVFLGDSITAYGDGPTGFVGLIRNAFVTAGRPKVEVINAGISGNVVPQLQERLGRDVLDKHPTVVFIYIGINDVWRNHGDLGAPKTAFEKGLRQIIADIQAQGGVVVLATPSVVGELPHGGNGLDAALDAFAQTSRTIAKDMNVELCDLRKAFVDYLNVHNTENKGGGVLTDDTIHMGPLGNRLIAQEAAKSLVAGIPRAFGMPIIHGGDFVDNTTVSMDIHPGPGSEGLVPRYTLDGSEPTSKAPSFAKPIALTKTTTITARAFRGEVAVGPTVLRRCTNLELKPTVTGVETVPGLAYAYYEGSSFGQLPDFATLTPVATGVTPDLSLKIRKREMNYALHFTGFITIPADGLYTLYIASDDGSRFFLDGQVLLDDDRVHGMIPLQVSLPLKAGLHPCVVDYFQGGGDQGLLLEWSSLSLPKAAIPASAFSSPKGVK